MASDALTHPKPVTALTRTVLITGATGFIGRHTVEGFRNAGWRVYPTSRTGHGNYYHFLSLDDVAGVRHTLASLRPDAVIHLAGIAHRRASPDEYDRINHCGTKILAQAIAHHCPGTTLVYASSATVYGDGPFSRPLREGDLTLPCDSYATSKLLGERAALACAPAIRIIAFRFPALYARDWLFNIRKRAYAPKPAEGVLVRLIGSHALYSFCAIENAVAAILRAASGSMAAGIYNLADQTPYTQADVVEVMRALEGRHLQVPVPINVIRPAYWALSALLPQKTRLRVRSAYHKLADGMVLDCTLARDAGYQPIRALQDLRDTSP